MYLYQKFNYKTKHLDINNKEETLADLKLLLDSIKDNDCKFMCFDTESTGLNIIVDKPFLVSIGGHDIVYTLDFDKEIMDEFFKMYQEYNFEDDIYYLGLLAHNCKFDYHMFTNGGVVIPEPIKLGDSITCARLTEFCDERVSMSLESLGGKYVDEEAKSAGKVIKALINKYNAEFRADTKSKIIDKYVDEGYGRITKSGKKIGNKNLTELLHKYDKRVDYVDNSEKYDFIKSVLKEANYETVYEREPDLMRSYALDDIVIMNEYLKKAYNPLKGADKDFTVFNREGKLIRVVSRMERTGFKVDIDYILKCRNKVLDYKELLYAELLFISWHDFTVGQHEYIKKFMLKDFNIYLEKCDNKALKETLNVLDHTIDKLHEQDPSNQLELKTAARDIIRNIIELRTVDKWLTTYIDGKLNSIIDGRIYTNINNNGAVSGRVSCDMQQQPKYALKDRDGNELFHPRKMFICDEGRNLIFIDESQMELRIQAYYTMALNDPDTNLCRAYVPYDCHNKKGYKYAYKNPIDIDRFEQHTWYKNEDNEEWHPTDLHNETTKHAFPTLQIGTEEFKKKRKLGKVCNFLKVYQGGKMALKDALDLDMATADILDQAFYKAFPKIKTYQTDVYNKLLMDGFVENLYGRRYYLYDKQWFYKGCNYLIQGTCADMVKTFQIELDKYLRENNLKTKLILPVHDEIIFSVPDDELHIIKKLQGIMENTRDIIKYIPMIADVEISTTNWGEKKDYEVK